MMKVIFRAEIKNVGKLSQSSFSSLVEIDKRYYAVGTESYSELGTYWIKTNDDREFECKEETRALNFEDMLDSEGTPIFASLSKDGKGGDRIVWDDFQTILIKHSDILLLRNYAPVTTEALVEFKVIGIQK